MKTKTKPRRRLLAAFVAACMLLLTVPIIAVFADDSGSGTDPKTSEITIFFKTGVTTSEFDQIVDAPTFTYTVGDEKPTAFTVEIPAAPNDRLPNNSFKEWKSPQFGTTYEPSTTATIQIKDLCSSDSYSWTMEDFYAGNVNYGYSIVAQWEEKDLDVSLQGNRELEDIGFIFNSGTEYSFFQPIQFHGTFNTDDGAFSFNNNENVFILDYKGETPKKQGNENEEFKGWSIQRDLSGQLYQNGDSITISSPLVFLYPVFESDMASRNCLNVIGQEDLMTPLDQGINQYDEEVTKDWAVLRHVYYNDNGIVENFVAPPALKNSLSTMSQWWDRENDIYYTPGETYHNVDVRKFVQDDGHYSWAKEMKLEPVWDSPVIAMNTSTHVDYDFQGSGSMYDFVCDVTGTFNLDTWEANMTGNSSYTIPSDHSNPERTGCTFKGWALNEFGEGKLYKNGETIDLTDPRWLGLYAVFSCGDNTIVEYQTGSRTVKVDVEPTSGLQLNGVDDFSQVKLTVSASAQEDTVKQALLQEEADDSYIMDISVTANGQPVQVTEGNFRVKMGFPSGLENPDEKYYKVYHYTNGNLEEKDILKSSDGLYFLADSFSPYVLVVEEGYVDPDDPGNTGSGTSDTPAANDSSDSDSDSSASDTPADGTAAQNATSSEAAPAVSNSVVTDKPDEIVAKTADGKQIKAGSIVVFGNNAPLGDKDSAKYIAMVKGNTETSLVYDITIRDKDGNILTLLPGQTVTVCLPRPAGSIASSLALFHIDGDKAEAVKITKVAADHIEFEATGFSPYVLTWKAAKSTGDPDNPGTGESGYLSVILFAVAALGAFGAATYKKRKETVE